MEALGVDIRQTALADHQVTRSLPCLGRRIPFDDAQIVEVDVPASLPVLEERAGTSTCHVPSIRWMMTGAGGYVSPTVCGAGQRLIDCWHKGVR